MIHSFNVELAKRYGILEAILIQNIYYWIEKNIANGKHYYDGRYWTYNSVKALSELFPYSSSDKIRRALDNLVKNNILLKGNYNKANFDKTLWYSFTDYAISIMQECQMLLANMPNGVGNSANPIPNINTNNKTNNNTPYNPPKGENKKINEELFNKFWNEYPKKKSKGNVEKWFEKNKPSEDLINLMIDKLKILKTTEQWTKKNGQYIPYPTTWLNAKGWEDEVTTDSSIPEWFDKKIEEKNVSDLEEEEFLKKIKEARGE